MVKTRGTLTVNPAQSLTVEKLHHVLCSESINRLRIEQQQDNLFVAINGADIPIKNKRYDLKTVLAVLNDVLTYYAATRWGLKSLNNGSSKVACLV
jgi:hypothetical protein